MSTRPQAGGPPLPQGQRHLVVVQDQDLMQAVTKALWNPPQSHVSQASDVLSARAAVQHYSPHAILIEPALLKDFQLPEAMNDVPVIEVSSPVDANELRTRVEAAIG